MLLHVVFTATHFCLQSAAPLPSEVDLRAMAVAELKRLAASRLTARAALFFSFLKWFCFRIVWQGSLTISGGFLPRDLLKKRILFGLSWNLPSFEAIIDPFFLFLQKFCVNV